jgi:hypothetical protein
VNIINSAKNRRKRRDWRAGNYQPASAIELENPGCFAREPNLATFIAAFRLSPGRFATEGKHFLPPSGNFLRLTGKRCFLSRSPAGNKQ